VFPKDLASPRVREPRRENLVKGRARQNMGHAESLNKYVAFTNFNDHNYPNNHSSNHSHILIHIQKTTLKSGPFGMIHRPRSEVQLLVHRPLRFVLAHSTARMQCVAISAAGGQKVVPQDGPSTSRFHLLGAWGCGQKHQETLFEYSFVVASRFILMDEA
jgi:hypothetical protein